MAQDYPVSITTYTNVTGGTTEGVSSKQGTAVGGREMSDFINDHNDDIEALQTKLGTGASTASANTVLRGTGAGVTGYSQLLKEDIDSSDLSGSDATLVTGTAGTNAHAAVWNADGDLVDGVGAPITTNDSSDGSILDGDKIDIDWNPSNYTPVDVAETDDVDDLSAHLAGIDATVSVTREIFLPVLRHSTDSQEYITENGGIAYAVVSATERVNLQTTIPLDFDTLTSVDIVMYPDATETVQWDTDIACTAAGESVSATSTTNTQLAVTANQITFADITSAVPTMAAEDVFSMDMASDTSDIRVVGVRLRYTV